jgi:hypothetical protein
MVAQVLVMSIGLAVLVSCGNQAAGTLTTNKPTAVYEQPTPHFYNQPNRVIDTIPAGESRPVRDLHYGKDFLMLEVEVPAGDRGFVDAADVSWSPANAKP